MPRYGLSDLASFQAASAPRRATALAALVLLVAPGAALADDHSDGSGGATVLGVGGAPTSGGIQHARDMDWFRFDVRRGQTYTVETSGLTGGMDSLLDVFGPESTHLGQDDDSAGSLASRFQFTAGRDGIGWAVIRHYDSNATAGGYRIAVTSPLATPTPIPTPTPTPTPTPSTSSATLAAASVLDPRLEGASLAIGSNVPGASYTASLRVVDAQGRVARTVVDGVARAAGAASDAWDGRDGSGRFVAPGAYTLRLEVARPGAALEVASRALRVVRAGLISVAFEGGLPISYHEPRPGSTGERLAVESLGPALTLPRSPLGERALDLADGTPLAIPAIWTDANAPPRASGTPVLRGRSLPVAFAQGARPRARLRLGDLAGSNGAGVPCGFPIAGAPIRIAVAGFAGAAGPASAEVSPGGEVVLDLPAVPATIGRHDLELDLRFEAWDGQAWRALPGRHRTAHRVYVVPGAAIGGGRAWVGVLDLVTGWATGARDGAAALAAITEGVNARQGLRYDVVQGAPAYAGGWSLTDPDMDLEGYLERSNGSVVNCLDCASAVTSLAAQCGVDSRVAVLGDNFDLHWLQGIGGTRFIHDLFGGWHAFSYHAVATVDGGQSVHDACLRVDDDSRPDMAPHAGRLPVAMPFARYRQQLSPDAFRVTGLGRAVVR